MIRALFQGKPKRDISVNDSACNVTTITTHPNENRFVQFVFAEGIMIKSICGISIYNNMTARSVSGLTEHLDEICKSFHPCTHVALLEKAYFWWE